MQLVGINNIKQYVDIIAEEDVPVIYQPLMCLVSNSVARVERTGSGSYVDIIQNKDWDKFEKECESNSVVPSVCIDGILLPLRDSGIKSLIETLKMIDGDTIVFSYDCVDELTVWHEVGHIKTLPAWDFWYEKYYCNNKQGVIRSGAGIVIEGMADLWVIFTMRARELWDLEKKYVRRCMKTKKENNRLGYENIVKQFIDIDESKYKEN